VGESCKWLAVLVDMTERSGENVLADEEVLRKRERRSCVIELRLKIFMFII
jgi:hypothetical protein